MKKNSLVVVVAVLLITFLSANLPAAENVIKLNGPEKFIELIEKNSDKFGLTLFEKQKAIDTWKIMLTATKNSERKIPLWQKFDPKSTALVVVDMQNAFIEEGAPIEIAKGRGIVDNINMLAEAVRKGGGKVIWIQYSIENDNGFLERFELKSYLGPGRVSPAKACTPGHPLFEIYPKLKVAAEDILLRKNRYGTLFSTLKPSLVEILNKREIKNVIVTGVSTDVCAGGTAEGLAQTGFNVSVAWDGTAALDRLIGHEGYLARFWLLYGEVLTSQQIIELLK